MRYKARIKIKNKPYIIFFTEDRGKQIHVISWYFSLTRDTNMLRSEHNEEKKKKNKGKGTHKEFIPADQMTKSYWKI